MIIVDCTLLCLAFTVVPLAIFLPWPHDDRLVVVPQNGTRTEYPNVTEVLGLWRANTSDVVPRLLDPARAEYFHERIRNSMHPPWRVLDAGCGNGHLANYLAGLPNYTVECLDPSLEALAHAEEAATKKGLRNIKFRYASVYFIPFEDHTFDAVILSGVLEHLLDLPSALLEVARVIRPGGLLLFTALDRSLMSYLFGLTWPDYVPRILSKQPHDWRLLVQPEELNLTLNVTTAFRAFHYKAFSPSASLLMQLAMAGLGLRALDSVSGNWSVGPLSSTTMFYIGGAVKAFQHLWHLHASTWQVGDICQIMASNGPFKGKYIPCAILGNGSRTDSLDVLVGAQNVSSVHVMSLKRMPNHTQIESFEEGELAEVATDQNRTKWKQCIILGENGTLPYLYRIRLEGRVMNDCAGYMLRKVENGIPDVEYAVDEWTQALWAGGKRNGEWVEARVLAKGGVRHFYKLHVPSAGPSKRTWHEIHTTRMRKIATYQVGEVALINGGRYSTKKWIRCTIKLKHKKRPLYDIHVPGLGDQSNVPVGALRKLATEMVYKAGDVAEVQSGDPGDKNGKWFKCVIEGLSKEPGKYDIRVRTGGMGNWTIIANIPFEALRQPVENEKQDQAAAGSEQTNQTSKQRSEL